jgi:hypothetical protein
MHRALIVFCLSSAMATSTGKPSECRCGVSPNTDLKYYSIPSDGGEPNPVVTRMSVVGTHEVIWVTYQFQTKSGSYKFEERTVRSDDGGHTWKADQTRHATPFLNSARSSVVYKYTGDDQISRSLDHGIHWEACKFNVDNLSATGFAQKAGGARQATLHFGLAAIHPINPRIIYGSLSVWVPSITDGTRQSAVINLPGIYVSHDSGDNWSMFAANLRGYSVDEPSKMGIDPSNTQRMIGHSGSGIDMSTDGGKTWFRVGEQSDLEKPAEIEGLRDEITKRSEELTIPEHASFTHLSVSQIEFDPHKSNIIYLVTNKGLYKSENSARTWCLIYPGRPSIGEVHSLVIDPEKSDRLFLSTHTQVLESEDGGCHFRVVFDWSNRPH